MENPSPLPPPLLNSASLACLFCRAFTDVCHVILSGGRDVLPKSLPRTHLSSAATSGDSSFSEPPAKRSRFASQPSTERGTTTAAASNSSTPAINDNNDDNDDNDQESDPCPSPSQPRPHSAVAAASPTSTGAGVVPAASVEAPTRPARLKEGRSRAVPGEGQEQVSRNLAKAEGWVVDSSSSSKSAQVKVEPPVMG